MPHSNVCASYLCNSLIIQQTVLRSSQHLLAMSIQYRYVDNLNDHRTFQPPRILHAFELVSLRGPWLWLSRMPLSVRAIDVSSIRSIVLKFSSIESLADPMYQTLCPSEAVECPGLPPLQGR